MRRACRVRASVSNDGEPRVRATVKSQAKGARAAREFPPRVVNPQTNETYVLLHAEMYERVRAILEQGVTAPALVRTVVPAYRGDEAFLPGSFSV